MKHLDQRPQCLSVLLSVLLSILLSVLSKTSNAISLGPKLGPTHRAGLWATALLAGLLSACAQPPKTGLYVHDAYIKTVIPGRTMTAAYASFTSYDPEPLCLSKFSGANARAVELHITESTGGPNSGRVAMREIDELCIAPGDTARLEPGGMHLMVMGVNELPAPPENTTLIIGTTDGRAFEVAFSVRPFNQ